MKVFSFSPMVGVLACLTVMSGPAWGAVIPQDVADLTAQADKIVIGDVVEVTSFWTADQALIKTRVVVRVDDYLKSSAVPAPAAQQAEQVARPPLPRGLPAPGNLAHREVLVLDGGTVDDVTLTVTVLPTFELGDRVLLFLDDHQTRLVGGFQGAYLTDGVLATELYPGCARARSDLYRSLADLLAEIADALPPAQAGHASIDAITPYHGDFTLPLVAPRYGLCGFDWTYKANPMGESYKINPNCSDAGAGSSAQQITQINNGTNAWNNAGADFSFNYGGTSGATSVTYNNVNLVFFSNNPPGGGGYVAATYIWQTGGNITECDLVFNDGDYSWWNGEGGCSGQFDIWNVATHEFGHFLCLADLYGGGDAAKTMYGYVSYCDTHARTLHSDDINGIIAIYGVAGPSCGDGNCDPGEDQCSCPADCGNPPSTETDCTDGFDNDCDGLTDAADSDCQVGPPCTCGDINQSGGPSDLNDFATFANCFGLSAPTAGCDATGLACSDLNGDGVVDLNDFGTFALVFGLASTNSPPNCP